MADESLGGGAEYLVTVGVESALAQGLTEVDSELVSGLEQLVRSIQSVGADGTSAFEQMTTGASGAVASVERVAASAQALLATLSEARAASGAGIEPGAIDTATIERATQQIATLREALTSLNPGSFAEITAGSDASVAAMRELASSVVDVKALLGAGVELPTTQATASLEKLDAGLAATSERAKATRAALSEAMQAEFGAGAQPGASDVLFGQPQARGGLTSAGDRSGADLGAQARIQQLSDEITAVRDQGGVLDPLAPYRSPGQIDTQGAKIEEAQARYEAALDAASKQLEKTGTLTPATQANLLGRSRASETAALNAEVIAQPSVDRLAPFRDSVTGSVDVQAALAQAQALADEVKALKAAQAGATGSPIAQKSTEAADLKAQALAAQAEQQAAAATADSFERQQAASAFVAEQTAKIRSDTTGIAAAEAQVEKATLAVQAAVQAGVADQSKLLGLVQAQVTAEGRLASAQAKADLTQAGGGGFFGGIMAGLGGGGGKHGNFGGFSTGGGGAEDAGFQIASVAKYIVYYQAFREIETAIRSTIDQTVAYDRAVTDLGNRLDLTSGQAQNLGKSLSGIGSVGGLAPAETVNLGAQFAGVFAGEGSPTDLATAGATIGTQLAVLSGSSKDASANLQDLTAATRAFDLTANDVPRVLDAATSAAMNFGLANATAIMPGLAQIGDLANQAGFSVEQTANTLADLQARTGESSAATAGELQRFFGRQGNTAFQQVFANLGVNTLQPFNDELAQLSGKFDTLTQRQKDFITAEFGGGRAGVAALALIQDYGRVQDATNKSISDGGIAQDQFYKRIGDVKGILDQVAGDFKEIAVQIGSSGIGAGVGLLLETLLPVLQTAKDLLAVLDDIPAPIREGAAIAAELYGVLKLIQVIQEKNLIGGAIGRVRDAVGGGAAAGVAEGVIASGGGAIAASGEAAAGGAVTAAEAELAGGIETGTVGIIEALAQLRLAILAEIGIDGEASALGVSGALGNLRTAIVAEGAGLGGALKNLVAGIGAPGVAIGGAILIDSVLNAQNSILSAQTAGAGAGSVQDLQNAANQAGNIAAKDRHDSSGVVGSTLNFLEGDPTGKAARQAADQAAYDQAQIKQQQAAIAGAPTTVGRAEGLVNLQDASDGTNGLKTSLDNLAAAGYTAQQQIDAVTQRLEDASRAAQGFIPTAQYGQIGSQGGTDIASTLRNFIMGNVGSSEGFAQSFVSGDLWKNLAHPKQGPDDSILKSIDSNKLAGAAGGAITDFLETNDASGAPLTKEQITQEKSSVLAAVVQNLKDQGKSAKDIQKIMPDLITAVGGAVSGQLSQLAAQGDLSTQDITNIAKSLASTAAQAGKDAGVNAALSGGDQGLADANAALADAQKTRADLAKQKNVTPDALNQADQDIRALKLAQQQASVKALASDQSVVESAISPFDKSGQLAAQISDAEAQLRSGPQDTESQNALKAKINQLKQQQAAQTLADTNAARDAAVSPADATGLAAAKLQDAQATLAGIVASGVTSGADYSNAVAAVNQAAYTYATDRVNDANAARDAAIDPRNSVAAANAKLQDAQDTLAGLVAAGATGSVLSNAQGAVLQAQVAAQQAAIQQQAAGINADARSGDPLSTARASLQAAQLALTGDLPGTTQFFTDLKAVHDAEAQLASAISDGVKNYALLNADTTDPVAQANATLLAAIVKQREDNARGVGDQAADQLAVENAQQAALKATFDQNLQDASTSYNLHQTSAAQYLQYLQGQQATLQSQLAATKKGSEGYRQLLDELNEVNQDILNLSTQYQGQFNLGQIKVPTVYDVRSAIAQQAAGAQSTVYQQVTFQVNGADTAAVKQIISSVLGQAPLSTNGVTTRKVAA